MQRLSVVLVLAIACLIGILLCIGQVVTLAWLSTMPKYSELLNTLEEKAYVYIGIAIPLIFVDIYLWLKYFKVKND